MMGMEFADLVRLHAHSAAGGELDAQRLLDDEVALDPMVFCRSQAPAGVSLLMRHFGIGGYCTSVHTACASGGQAIGTGMKLIRRGTADCVLAGGFDSMITPIGLAGFCLLNAVSPDNDTPERASRPFDATRNGFVLGEGAGFLVLEEWEGGTPARCAHLRGARRRRQFAQQLPHHRFASVGRRADPVDAAGARRRRRIVADVDYVNAHGTSTPMNDRSESAAVHAVFGPDVERVAVSSTKSVMGHLIAAAGAVEAAVCALAIQHGELPVNANLSELDPDCDLNIVRDEPRRAKVRVAMSNSFGFGGSNSCLAFRHPEEVDGRRAGDDRRSASQPRNPNRWLTQRTSSSRAPARCAPPASTPPRSGTPFCAGRSALSPIRQWDTTDWPRRIAGEIVDLDPVALLQDRKIQKFIRRSDVFGLYAADQAIEARASPRYRDTLDEAAATEFSDRTGVYVGSGGGSYQSQYDYFPLLTSADGDLQAFGRELGDTVNPMWLLRTLPNNVLCHVGIRHGLKGPNACITNHSISGMLAIVEAMQAVRQGEADRAVAVGHDSPIEPQAMLYFHELGLLAQDTIRSFDVHRDGSLFGEGAAALVLETRAAAEQRGAKVLGEVLGSGCASDAQGLFAIDDDGAALGRCHPARARGRPASADRRRHDRRACQRHAPVGRFRGGCAHARVRREPPPVTGFKWAFGHLIAASGIIETALALSALRARIVPGIATLRELDPACAGLPVSSAPSRRAATWRW